MKYVVLGANGQLGRDLCPRLPGEVVPLTREQLDLCRLDAMEPALLTRVRQVLELLAPDVVINCAAYNFVDRAEKEIDIARSINSTAVAALVKCCAELGSQLVHFSSDYVFGRDEERNSPYREEDRTGPVNEYGKSKLMGEYPFDAFPVRHFLIRTCGLYGVWGSGGKGGNFVETMLRLAKEGKPIRVVNDQTCTPSYTVDVAEATVALMQTGKYGLYHITNSGSCTWLEFAQAIFELAGVKADLTPISSKQYGAAAMRPRYSVLDTGKYHALGLPPIRSWQDALKAYLRERERK